MSVPQFTPVALPIVGKLRGGRTLPPGCLGVSGDVATEAAGTIEQLYEALEGLLESYLDALPGSEDYGPVLEANSALVKARGER